MNSNHNDVTAGSVRALFEERYGYSPTLLAAAPGRVNLIGEHTDYNNGFVLPMALERHTIVAVSPGKTTNYRISSSLMRETAEIPPSEILSKGEPFWTNYIRGVLAGLSKIGINPGPIDIFIDSNVPGGGGLSSSAALEVACATAFSTLSGKPLLSKKCALLCQKAEHDYVGVPCGIMDQFISAHGAEHQAIMLDCESLEFRFVPFIDPNVAVLIVDSAVKHSLADGAYAQRRAQCEQAAKIIGVPSLRQATLEMLEAKKTELGDICYRRARHVIGENNRVHDFADAVVSSDWTKAGVAMRGSHASLRDDYEVSCAELDTLVALCDEIPSADAIHGARLTGGGFGGSIVALVDQARVEEVAKELIAAYANATGIETSYLVTKPGAGARVLS